MITAQQFGTTLSILGVIIGAIVCYGVQIWISKSKQHRQISLEKTYVEKPEHDKLVDRVDSLDRSLAYLEGKLEK